MLLQTFPEFEETPPVLLDWLSWHHTFGGSTMSGSPYITAVLSILMMVNLLQASSMRRFET